MIDREELAAIKKRHEVTYRFKQNLTEAEADRAALLDALEAAEARKERLREALELLVDHQNGCPLPKYEAEWTRAMQLSLAALAETAP